MKRCICFFIHRKADGRPLLVRLGDYLTLPRHELLPDWSVKDAALAALKGIAFVVRCSEPTLIATDEILELDGAPITAKFFDLGEIRMIAPTTGRASYRFNRSLTRPDIFVERSDSLEILVPRTSEALPAPV